MARVTGLEPATSGVTGRRSNQLSYTRVHPGTGVVGEGGGIGFGAAGCQARPDDPRGGLTRAFEAAAAMG